MSQTTSAYSYGIPGRRTLPAPAPSGYHQWVATAVFDVPQAHVDANAALWMAGGAPVPLDLTSDNVIATHGPLCLKCNQPLTPTTYATRCPVVLVPVLGIVAK